MKKIILFFFIPLIFLSQENDYNKKISVSDFVKELELASIKGEDYFLEDCEITYDPVDDKKYVIDNLDLNKFEGDALIKNINFKENSVTIKNCKFGDTNLLPRGYISTIQFKNCVFYDLTLQDINVGSIHLDSVKVIDRSYITTQKNKKPHQLNISNSSIFSLIADSQIDEKSTFFYKNLFSINDSKVDFCTVSGWEGFWFYQNQAKALLIGGKHVEFPNMGDVFISNNVFSDSITNVERIKILDSNNWHLSHFNGIIVSLTTIDRLSLRNNKLINKELHLDINLDDLKDWENPKFGRSFITDSPIEISELSISEFILNNEIYEESWSIEKKIKCIKQYIKNNDVNFHRNIPMLRISSSEIKDLNISDDTIPRLLIKNNKFLDGFRISKINVDSLIEFSNNSLPDYNRTYFDSTFFKKLGVVEYSRIDTNGENLYIFKPSVFYGNETNTEISYKLLKDKFNKELIPTLRQLINVSKNNGSPYTNSLIFNLKDVETTIKSYDYLNQPSINNWFNYRGSQFLSWYSDYGMNPFKALYYSFWVMMYFAIFYFFFSSWDVIQKSYLVNRFQYVIDYFTSEKRIEDFYVENHQQEISTFRDFRDSLEKNKVQMPYILLTLARPIYQVSLLRYKTINFFYKKVEFMAGRKWENLSSRERYGVGAIIVLLSVIYIFSLLIIRALNSIALSINVFSTLGFGNIPIRGFTKYIAILEGFIGWFLLSIFLVSVLNQMVNF